MERGIRELSGGDRNILYLNIGVSYIIVNIGPVLLNCVLLICAF